MNKPTSINFSNYFDDPEGLKKVIKIAIIGPSRVGKTSIIAALLDEAKRALAQTRILIKASTDEQGSSPTRERINNTIREIEAGLECSQFNPTGIGTAYPFIYDLQMSVIQFTKTEKSKSFHFAILDFPGGWLTEITETDNQKLWGKCKDWINESSVLIVTVDSNLVIQARLQYEKERSKKILEIEEVQQLIEVWAKFRVENQESALLLFVPVKCGTYFNDNGGNRDWSEELYKQISSNYSQAIDLAKKIMSNQDNNPINSKERPNYRIEYHPIDTIGCIELSDATWKRKNGEVFLDCSYLIRNPDGEIPKRKPYGTQGLLTAICKQILASKTQKRDMLERVLDWFRGDDILAKTIEMLSEIPYTSRVKIISQGKLAEKNQ